MPLRASLPSGLCLPRLPPQNPARKQSNLPQAGVCQQGPGGCRSSSSIVLTHVAAPRVPHASTGRSDPSDHSLRRTRQLSVFGVPWLLTTRNKNLVIDCFDWGFSACFESGFNTRTGGFSLWFQACFSFLCFLIGEKKPAEAKTV